MAKEDQKLKHFSGNVFGKDNEYFLQVPKALHDLYLSNNITDAELNNSYRTLIESKQGKSEELSDVITGETIENPYYFDPINVKYNDSFDLHVKAYETEKEKMDKFLDKLGKGFDVLKNGSKGKEDDLFAKKIIDLASGSIRAGYDLFDKFSEISSEGMDEFELRNILYEHIISFDEKLTDYFNVIKKALSGNGDFKPQEYNVLTLLHGFSKICTMMLEKEKEAGIVKPEITDDIDVYYETKYDQAEGYALDELENIRADLRERINRDISHRIKDPKTKYLTRRGQPMTMQEVRYDNLNFLDDAVLHLMRFVFGIDAQKEN